MLKEGGKCSKQFYLSSNFIWFEKMWGKKIIIKEFYHTCRFISQQIICKKKTQKIDPNRLDRAKPHRTY